MPKAVQTPAELRDAQGSARFSERDAIDVNRWIMESPQGRKYMWELLADCGIFRSTIGEHHVMAFHEGKRVIGLKQLRRLQADPQMRKLFATMQNENTNTENEQ